MQILFRGSVVQGNFEQQNKVIILIINNIKIIKHNQQHTTNYEQQPVKTNLFNISAGERASKSWKLLDEARLTVRQVGPQAVKCATYLTLVNATTK